MKNIAFSTFDLFPAVELNIMGNKMGTFWEGRRIEKRKIKEERAK